MHWPSVQPWCRFRNTFYMLLLYSSIIFTPFLDLVFSTLCGFALSGPINHLVEECEDLEDDNNEVLGDLSSSYEQRWKQWPLINFTTHPMSCCSSIFQPAIVAQSLSLYSLVQNGSLNPCPTLMLEGKGVSIRPACTQNTEWIWNWKIEVSEMSIVHVMEEKSVVVVDAITFISKS